MNDRYLYKAKRTDNGEWVEGNLVLSEDVTDDFRSLIIPTKDSYMFCDSTNADLGFEIWHIVNPSTICRCTGLKDRNGKMIWENDIVESHGYIGIVRYGQYNTHFGFGIEWIKSNGELREDFMYWVSKIWIAGNISDNPELLEGGAE